MEIAAAVLVPAAESASPLVANRWRYHRDIKKNMVALREVSEKLNRRKSDKKKSLENEVESGEAEEVEEVKFWLERVEKISNEVEEIGKKVARVKFFSRAGLGKKVVEMIPKVEKLYEEGAFGEGNMVRKLPLRGIEKPTATILEGETTTENTRDEILGCLIDKKVMKIGVCGMGGLGKTTVLEHVHNTMLKCDDEIGRQFDKVIWITASKDSNVKRLQDKIARELGVPISNDDDDEYRAKVLYREFNKVNNKRHILIIDDMWEAYPLQKVGVPEPTPENGCKLVLTTRSGDVCSQMKCDWIIKMGLLSEEESVSLFLDRVGQSVASETNLREMVKRVAKECAGLPLAIVTVAGSLIDKTDPIEWEVALTELKDATASVSCAITAILRFSYDRLKDEKLKKCLLYCALYSEDYQIERNLLIDQLIAEGIIEKAKPRQYKVAKGHVMLNELVSNCLLIDAGNHRHKKCVKLHDSVRDMLIYIMRESPSRFFVKVGGESETLNLEEKWDELVEKVSLMGNEIDAIPFVEPPKCVRLSTMFLNMTGLETIAEEFFLQMEKLCVLDLSFTLIRSLPDSVSSLTNLVVLLLSNCSYLICIPDLSNLRNLIRLDLSDTSINEVPQGLEKMTKLTYLDLHGTELRSFPRGILCELYDLQHLSLFFPFETDLSIAEELATLKKLETLKVSFEDFKLFNAFIKAISNDDLRLENYGFQVGLTVPFDINKNVILNCSRIIDLDDDLDLPIMLPKNVEDLTIYDSFQVSLCRLVSIENTTNLKRLSIFSSEMDYMFHYSPALFPLLQKIEELTIHGGELRGLVGSLEENEVVFPSLPTGAFSSLKKLIIRDCFEIKTLLVLAKDSLLPSLEEIEIYKCRRLEEIIAIENEDAILDLPSLRKLMLSNLPKLKSVPFVANSMSSVAINRCPELKKIVFLERKPSLSSFKFVYFDVEPWMSLGREHMLTQSL